MSSKTPNSLRGKPRNGRTTAQWAEFHKVTISTIYGWLRAGWYASEDRFKRDRKSRSRKGSGQFAPGGCYNGRRLSEWAEFHSVKLTSLLRWVDLGWVPSEERFQTSNQDGSKRRVYGKDYNGRSLAEWAALHDVTYPTISKWMRNGWDPSTDPPGRKGPINASSKAP